MTRIVRTFGRNTVRVDTIHPQVGPITRGRICAEPDHDGAGAFGVWRVVDPDHVDLPLLVVGDYLTAEKRPPRRDGVGGRTDPRRRTRRLNRRTAMTTPMLAAAQHPRSPRTAQPHRTNAQVRRTNRRQEQAEVRKLADHYVRVSR